MSALSTAHRPVARAQPKAAMELVIALARALQRHGTPAPHLEASLDGLARRLGLDGRFFSAPTAIMLAFHGPDRHELLRVDAGEIDLDKLSRLDAVIAGVEAGALSIPAATAKVRAIDEAPPRYRPLPTVLAFGLGSANAAVFLGGGAVELLIALGLGAVVGGLAAVADRSTAFRRLFQPVAAFVVTALALGVAAAGAPVSVPIAVVAGLIVLVPGLSLTVAVTELVHRHLVSGTARLAGALVSFIELGFGVALASALLAEHASGGIVATPLPAGAEWAALLLTPLALTVILRAQPRDIGWIAVAGGIGFITARAGTAVLGPALGAFPAALAVSLAAETYHRRLGRPAAIPAVPGLLLLVPGSVGFRSVSALLADDVVAGVGLAFTMVMVAVSIVAGTLVASAILPQRLRR